MAEKTDLNKVVDKVLVSEEELQRRIAELGAQLSEDYEGKDVICVCILRGAVHFFSDLVRHMTCMTELDFMSISSYGNGKSAHSQGYGYQHNRPPRAHNRGYNGQWPYS